MNENVHENAQKEAFTLLGGGLTSPNNPYSIEGTTEGDRADLQPQSCTSSFFHPPRPILNKEWRKKIQEWRDQKTGLKNATYEDLKATFNAQYPKPSGEIYEKNMKVIEQWKHQKKTVNKEFMRKQDSVTNNSKTTGTS